MNYRNVWDKMSIVFKGYYQNKTIEVIRRIGLSYNLNFKKVLILCVLMLLLIVNKSYERILMKMKGVAIEFKNGEDKLLNNCSGRYRISTKMPSHLRLRK